MAVQRNGGSEGHANKSSADKKRDAAETAAEQKRVSELYMEEMSRDFGPVEEGDESFMRNFPTAFVSWETLESALQQYTESTCQVIRKHTTQTTANRNQATQKYLDGFRTPGTFLGSFYPDEMEWYKKVWVCSICRAFNVRARGFQASRSSGSAARRQQETEIKITAQLNPYKQDRDKFYIEVSWSGMHNHRCDEDAVLQFEREGSRIDDPAVLSIVREMRRHGKTPREIKRLGKRSMEKR
uniref:FAR1 domain-containing protein n=1 Tax=Globisporangium ultimum (strain ATCC 200006 / CBS 805.95 / DAOM BR144) TaxID=431595 RepID=K3X7Z3_GLOUD